MNETHNGWTNYATWRVNLEMFDNSPWRYELPKDITPEQCQEMVEDFIYDSADNLVQGWAMAFLSEVNWHEIAEHMRDEIAEHLKEE